MNHKNMSNFVKTTSIIAVLMLSVLVASLPAPAAYAQQAPTITLSTTSGYPYGISAAVGFPPGQTALKATRVVVTGTGFPAPKEDPTNPGQDDITIRFADTMTTTTVSPSSGTALVLYTPSREGTGWPITPAYPFVLQPPRVGTTVRADANGFFEVAFDVPAMKGDPYNVWAVYQNNGVVFTTAAVPFNIVPHIAIVRNPVAMTPDGRFGETLTVDAVGFGDTESVQFIPGNVVVTTSLTTGSDGRATTLTAYVGSLTGGNKTVTAYGSGSGSSASTNFLVSPSIAVFNTATPAGTMSSGTVSVKATGPATFYMVLRGFGNAENIPANSITVGGISTIHNSITTTSNGDYGTTLTGTDFPLSVTVTGNIPIGKAAIVVNGRTFDWGPNRNILPPNTDTTQLPSASPFPMGCLLASNSQVAPGPGLLSLDKPNYNVGDRFCVFGIGFQSGGSVTNVVYTEAPGGAGNTRSIANFDLFGTKLVSAAAVTPDANGAFIAMTKGGPNALPESPMVVKGTDNTVTAVSPGFTVPGTSVIVRPKVTIVSPKPYWFNNQAKADQTSSLTISGTGFGVDNSVLPSSAAAPEQVTVYLGTNTFTSSITPTTDGSFANVNMGPLGVPSGPEVPNGLYQVTANGTTAGNGASSTDTAVPPRPTYIALKPVYGFNAISLNTGSAQLSTIVLQSPGGSTPGIRGLAPNVAYNVYFDVPGTLVGSFTSTAAGEVPSGVQFLAPTGVNGYHLIDIRNAATGSSAVWGNLVPSGQQFTNMIFFLSVSFTATPSAGIPGDTVMIAGAGMKPGLTHAVEVPVLGANITYASFTSTATGAIPTGVSFVMPDRPVVSSATNLFPELGTTINVYVFQQTTFVGYAPFVLRSGITLDKTSAAVGDVVQLTAKGLDATKSYNVVFDWSVPAQASTYSGTVVAGIIPNVLGTATTYFTVPPSAVPGSTVTIMLLQPSDTTQRRLASPPSLTITGGGVGPGATFNTSTFESTVKSDQASYTAGQQFQVSFQLGGTGTIDYVVTVKDPNGVVIYPISKTEGLPITGSPSTITVTSAVPPSGAKGVYTINVQILRAGSPVDFKMITFTVS